MTRARLHFGVRQPGHYGRVLPAIVVLVSLVVAVLQIPAPAANAAGPAYSGPETASTGPAFFGPAPNPFPYCENPTYFDPLPENVNPIGRIDPTGSPNASVTTNGITLDFELTAEGEPDTQYPGFFPQGGDGDEGDQPKGVEMAGQDEAVITLSQPLFYTQWIFTDVDRENEGFFVTPAWTSAPGQIAVFGGDANFEFAGTTTTTAVFNDTDVVAQDSEAIEGRVQVDMLGAVTGIELVRDDGSGQSGFAIGGGCDPIGVAKEVTSGPTWNPALGVFDVEYTIRVRNNLPSAATISGDIDAAIDASIAAGGSATTTGTPVGIDMTAVTLEDLLTDDAFASISVELLENTSGAVAVNDAYNGDTDINMIAAGETIGPETVEEFVLQLQYTPEETGPLGPTCAVSYDLENQAEAGGTADGVDVVDLSDSGANPDPGVNNGNGGVNDPTIVTFDCVEVADASLAIVKTVVAGPAGVCPDFDGGVAGLGTPLDIDLGDTVTYCVAVRNTSTVEITDVVLSDPQAPATFTGAIGTLAPGAEGSDSFDLVVDASTPTTNTATANGVGPDGALDPVTDDAGINPGAPPAGSLEIVKTSIAGPLGVCPDFAGGVAGPGTPLAIELGQTVTYCITVLNSSTVEITDVVVNDPQAPGSFDIGVLAAGAQATVSYDLVVGPDTPTTNTASATGTGPNGPLPEVSDPAGIDPAAPVAGISLSKTVVKAGTDCANAVEGTDEFVLGVTGDAIVWCFVVTNTGAVALTNVLFTDGPAGITDQDLLDGVTPPVLPVGESLSFSLEATIPEGGVENVASVVGDPSDANGVPIPGTSPVTDENDASINETSIDFVKTVVSGVDGDCAAATDLAKVNKGSEVTYCFTVTNTGGVHVQVTEVTDTTLGAIIAIPAAQQILAPGDSVTVSLNAQANDDLVNTASVTGIPVTPDGVPFVDPPPLNPTDPAEVEVLEADLSLLKRVNVPTAQAGELLTYTLDISNAGPDPAEDVKVVDRLPAGLELASTPTTAGWTCVIVSPVELSCERAEPLAAGATDALVYTVRMTSAAAFNTDLVNTATTTSSTPDPDLTNNEDIEIVTRTPPRTPTRDDIVTITVPPPTPPAVVPVPEPEPLPVLAFTGAQSWLTVTLSLSMAMLGGVLWVGARRSDDDDEFDVS